MKNNIAAKVRRLRERWNWTQEELAAVAALSSRTVQRIESGRPGRPDTLRALAMAFDLDVFQLLARTDIVDQHSTGVSEVHPSTVHNRTGSRKARRKVPRPRFTIVKRGDIPKPEDFPPVLFERLLWEVVACAAYTPKAARNQLAWALVGIAQIAAPRIYAADDEAPGWMLDGLDIRIRQALAITVTPMLDLWPDYAEHIATCLVTLAYEIVHGGVHLEVLPLPEPGPTSG